jgi:hypothetical protein
MNLFRGIAALAALAMLPAGLARGQDQKPPHATPSDEHSVLNQFVGEWKSTGKGMDPSGKMTDMPGFEFDRMVLGDFWLFFVYNSQIAGKPFVGHGMIGYDPARKKYVGSWVDSMSPYMTTFEGTTDKTNKILTLETFGTDPMTEKSCKGRMVFEFQDQDHRSLKSYKMDDSGESKLVFELHYTREQAQSK